MRRVVRIVIEAWSAIVVSRLASGSLHASGRPLDTSSAPIEPSSSVSGTAITELIPDASMKRSTTGRCRKRGSRR